MLVIPITKAEETNEIIHKNEIKYTVYQIDATIVILLQQYFEQDAVDCNLSDLTSVEVCIHFITSGHA